MMKCINCGNEIERDLLLNINKCSNCNLEWSQAEHIDDMTYLIQELNRLKLEISILQQDNKELKEAMNQLLLKMGV